MEKEKKNLPACFIASCISPYVFTINNDQFSDSLNMDHRREGVITQINELSNSHQKAHW